MPQVINSMTNFGYFGLETVQKQNLNGMERYTRKLNQYYRWVGKGIPPCIYNWFLDTDRIGEEKVSRVNAFKQTSEFEDNKVLQAGKEDISVFVALAELAF